MSSSANSSDEKKFITAVELKQSGIGSTIYYLYPCQMWETESGECLKDDKSHFHIFEIVSNILNMKALNVEKDGVSILTVGVINVRISLHYGKDS